MFLSKHANGNFSIFERLKQEAEDLHKAEDRARRDAILQQYLQRKAQQQQEETQGGSNGVPSHPVHRRQKAMRATRPKSQPPPAARNNSSLLSRSQNTKDDSCAKPGLHDDSSEDNAGKFCLQIVLEVQLSVSALVILYTVHQLNAQFKQTSRAVDSASSVF